MLKDIFEHALPATMQDVVVIFVTVCGWREGRYTQETYANKVYAGTVAGRTMSATQVTTAAGIATALDLLAEDRLPQAGFVQQEDIPLTALLGNRHGQIYDSKVTSAQ